MRYKLTLLKSTNVRLLNQARQEDYRRGIKIFAQAIADFKTETQKTMHLIAQLEAEKSVTTDAQRLAQINVDIAYLQNTLKQLQPAIKIQEHEQALLSYEKDFADLQHH